MDGGWFTDGPPNFVSTKKLLAVTCEFWMWRKLMGLERLFEEEVWSAEMRSTLEIIHSEGIQIRGGTSKEAVWTYFLIARSLGIRKLGVMDCIGKEKIEDAIKECTKALELNPTYMKALTRRAEAHEKLEHFEALADTKKILELDPSNSQARRAIPRLEQLAKEKQEKLKEEMIGKHKECFY
ncbi:Tetratricopeptide repeat protein 1 [Vitis vinifera]|uniref:Tetratricopeptide repeat protein 1 n=1 Tax=Vitis vinifera TaxID=29760 RepID=A0A438HJU3_VITVI|nr:Tetratricopeptide repeat protein 1 [Vitis vinifera]